MMRDLWMSTALAIVALTPLCAQNAASATFALVPGSFTDGGVAQTATYALVGTFGTSPATAVAASTNHRLEGGMLGGIAVTTGALPLLVGVQPQAVTMRGAAALTVHGTGLIWGTAPTLTIGGVPASIGTRTTAQLATVLPNQPTPGWQPVTFSSLGYTTTLSKGVAVLPMLEAQPAPGLGVPFDLVFRGRQGDAALFCFSFATGPLLPLGGLGHGLGLDTGSLVASGVLFVGSPHGELRLPIPAFNAALTLYFQAAALTSDPGYAPGAFTNVLRIY